LRAKPYANIKRAFTHALAFAATAVSLWACIAPSSAEELSVTQVVPAALTSEVNARRQEFYAATQPKLTPELLQAYVDRKQQLAQFDAFDVPEPVPQLNESVLLGYIARRQNQALDAIDAADLTARPALNPDVLSAYAAKDFVPTVKRVKLADSERNCLAQAIYHEARGESREGQLAVANVIINRAFSKKYPTTICGVVYQNADKGKYKCQFTFACDGRSDVGRERAAWNRSVKLAEAAFREFQSGERPGVIPDSVLYYHTTAVSPSWGSKFQRVATIGSHIFYASN
jgi:spore germination cell wall hydrolase CwlJ-like protein